MRKRRFISWLLTICLLLGMVPVTAYAEGNTTTTTISGDDTAQKTGTMTITLVIPKKTPAATDLTYTAPSELTYNGSDKVATVAAASGVTGLGNITVKYYSDANRTTEAAPKNVGTYYVGATVAEGDQYAASTAVLYGDGWTFEITKSTPTAPAAPTKASATKNSITLNAVSGCEYSKDGTTYQDSTEFTGLLPSTEYTFYQRFKATANTNASGASSVPFSTEADTYAMTITLVIKPAQTITASDVTATYGDTDKKISATTDGDGAISYAVKDGSGDYISVNESTGALTIKEVPPTDGKAYVIVIAAETDNYAKATKEVVVTISQKTSTGGNHRPSSSSGSSTPSTPSTQPSESYTVPVSNEGSNTGSVDVSASIKDGTAEVGSISAEDIAKLTEEKSEDSAGSTDGAGDGTTGTGDDTTDGTGNPDDGKTDGTKPETTTILIDVSEAKQEVNAVELKTETVETIAEASEKNDSIDGVTIKMTNSSVELDGTATAAIAEQAEGESVKLVVDNTETSNLNNEQKEALKEYNTVGSFEAYFESNGNRIHDFKGGKATVSMKFEPEKGKDINHYHLYYLADDGSLTRHLTRWINGFLQFITTHFSDYVIVYDENIKNATEEGDDWKDAEGTDQADEELPANCTRNEDGTIQYTEEGLGSVKVAKEAIQDGAVYRMYNANNGEHFYTKDAGERDSLVANGWTYEADSGFDTPGNEAGVSPVYRVYNPNSGLHHYTIAAGEAKELVRIGWNFEGIAFFAYGKDSGTGTPLYRAYNPNDGTHNYTASKAEQDHLISVGWNDEQFGWSVK